MAEMSEVERAPDGARAYAGRPSDRPLGIDHRVKAPCTYALELVLRSSNEIPELATRSRTVLDTKDLARPGLARHARSGVHRDPTDPRLHQLALSRVQPARIWMPRGSTLSRMAHAT